MQRLALLHADIGQRVAGQPDSNAGGIGKVDGIRVHENLLVCQQREVFGHGHGGHEILIDVALVVPIMHQRQVILVGLRIHAVGNLAVFVQHPAVGNAEGPHQNGFPAAAGQPQPGDIAFLELGEARFVLGKGRGHLQPVFVQHLLNHVHAAERGRGHLNGIEAIDFALGVRRQPPAQVAGANRLPVIRRILLDVRGQIGKSALAHARRSAAGIKAANLHDIRQVVARDKQAQLRGSVGGRAVLEFHLNAGVLADLLIDRMVVVAGHVLGRITLNGQPIGQPDVRINRVRYGGEGGRSDHAQRHDRCQHAQQVLFHGKILLF